MAGTAVDAEREHFVYRLWDGDGTLLYVGCTKDLYTRLYGHAFDMRFFRDVSKAQAVRYANRGIALTAEREAIQAERPRYNVQHNPASMPGGGYWLALDRQRALIRGEIATLAVMASALFASLVEYDPGSGTERPYASERRSPLPPRRRARCVAGHPFSEDNTRTAANGARSCITCDLRRGREYYARKKARAASAVSPSARTPTQKIAA